MAADQLTVADHSVQNEDAYAYDVYGNRTSLTDPVGNETQWVYDLWGNTLREVNELEDIAELDQTQTDDGRWFTYNVAGQLLTRVDRLNQKIAYTHDRLGRTTQEDWSTLASGTIRTEL